MPIFQQLRIWLKEGPRTERRATAGGVLVLAVLLALALIPGSGPAGSGGAASLGALPPQGVGTLASADPGSVAAAPGASIPSAEAPGAATTAPADSVAGPVSGPVPGPAVGAPAAGATTAPPKATATTKAPTTKKSTASAAQTASSSAACKGLTAAGPGVTATTVNVDTTNLSLAGPIGNSTFDVRGDLAAIAQAMVDDINAHGGVACGRKIVLKQYDVNPLDPTDGQSKCLTIQSDNPLIDIDFGGYLTPAARSCFAQAKIPMTGATPYTADELKGSYPYLFGMRSTSEQAAHNGILGLSARGFFKTPTFTKLGLFEDACAPSVNTQIDNDLASIGIKSSQVSKFMLDCSISAAPNQISQAVLQHRGDNVSHVFFATSDTNDQNYVKIATGQQFHPRYGMSDYGESMTQAGAENWDASFDGAVGITSSHEGEFAAGVSNSLLKQCDAIMKAHGVPGFSSENKDAGVLGYCDLFWFFKAILDHDGPNPTRQTLVNGVSSLGAFSTAYSSDGVFNRPGKITGGDYQREDQYHSDCGCWKIAEPAFGPGYS